MNNLSKRIIVLESEKIDLRNQYENLKLNYDDLLRKHTDIFTEAQSRVRLQDHLNQTSELKRCFKFFKNYKSLNRYKK